MVETLVCVGAANLQCTSRVHIHIEFMLLTMHQPGLLYGRGLARGGRGEGGLGSPLDFHTLQLNLPNFKNSSIFSC